MQIRKLVFSIIVCSGIALFACTSTPEQPAAEPVPQPEAAVEPTIRVSQEDYDRTFSEVEAVINELNGIIRAGNMGRWEGYLTPEFRAWAMSPGHLAELNDSVLLKRNNIRVTNMREYFEHVVMPSRARVRLDNMEFVTENRVEAFMTVSGESGKIYQLEKVNDNWRISVW